jgi:hypothetical protein
MILQEVAVSGTIGKQVFPTTAPSICMGFSITPSGANTTIKIRKGNASGEVVFYGKYLSAFGTKTVPFKGGVRFDSGMHVKILGAAAVAYLQLN